MRNSTIMSVLQEADEFTLPEAPAAPAPTEEFSPEAAAAAITPAPAPAPNAGPTFPTATGNHSATVQKTVLNKELILTIFSAMKSLIANSEKQLGSDEIPIEDARIYINTLIDSLAYNANRLSSIVNESGNIAPPIEQGVTTPSAALPPAPFEAPVTEPNAALPPPPGGNELENLEL